jgi:hypothetical protein
MFIYNDLMGTNFYTLRGKHIGKRSAAGLYCWNCNITLCKEGEQNVHSSFGYVVRDDGKGVLESLADMINYQNQFWYEECPRCHEKTNVKPCSSFSWDVNPSKISKLKYIKSEYGDKLTKDEFLNMLDGCPIRFFDSIGKDFS